MNIFLDTKQISEAEFPVVADCLSAHEHDLDQALLSLQRRVPSSLAQFYHPLRLGGVYDGPPPYNDPSYANDVADLLSATRIPAAGGFSLYRGRAAAGDIEGHRVTQCPERDVNCGEMIEMADERGDQSDWFLIFSQLGPRSWGQKQVPPPFPDNTRQGRQK